MSILLRILTFLRDAFMFAPIIVTWVHISSASGAYEKYLAALPEPKPGQPVLRESMVEQWVSGFGGASDSLSVVAQQVVICVAIAATLTVLVSMFQHSQPSSSKPPVDLETYRPEDLQAIRHLSASLPALDGTIRLLAASLTEPDTSGGAAMQIANTHLSTLVSTTDEIANGLARLQNAGSTDAS